MKYGFKEYAAPEILEGHLNVGGSNPGGERIDVNSSYFTRGGRPWIPVMGEFHFSRCARKDWYRELCKMKAGGITLVSTYMFWIYHEETEGKIDFSGDNDIRAFVLECQRAGLEVVLRVGPWAHGECRNGGFPDWLLRKPFKLREDNPEYLKLVHGWYSAIAAQVEGLFYQDGGNIVAVQLENEFVDDAGHLATLKKIAIECGLIAPLYTVTGWNSAFGAKIPVDEVVPVFGGYCEAPWESHTRQLEPSVHYFFNQMRNDSAIGKDQIALEQENSWKLPYERYPFATCELGGGIQVTHHRRPIIEGMDIYAVSLVKLGDGNNLPGYYMYHGGTNKLGRLSTFQESRATGYPNDYAILSYDFQGALSEYGEVREQYRLLNMLHLFLADFQESFAPLTAVDAVCQPKQDDTTSLRYGMRTDGERGFVFINHYQRLTRLEDVKDVVIDTGSVVFPSMDVCGDVSFFVPFQMEMGNVRLKCALAQPLCKQGNVYFFAEIPGIPAQYELEDGQNFTVKAGLSSGFCVDGTKVVTLTWEQAKYLRRLDGELYLGEGCDLYLKDGAVLAVEDGVFDGWHFNGTEFEPIQVGEPYEEPVVTWENVEQAPFEPPYGEELQIGTQRGLTWKKLTVEGSRGFVVIDEAYDAAQIYADGVLTADNYYYGRPWRVPAALLCGRECYLVMSEMKEDFYREF